MRPASIKEAGISDMSISPVQGSFLQLLVKLTRAAKVLELGTFAGYGTIWLARGLPEQGRLITMEFNSVHADMAKKNIGRAGLHDKVDLRTGKAIELLPELATGSIGPFDLIFIDADKPPYAEYFEWALKLSRPGTLIIFDNVIRNGHRTRQVNKPAADPHSLLHIAKKAMAIPVNYVSYAVSY
jgi:caffeoyl-CoA O-methyltransferase